GGAKLGIQNRLKVLGQYKNITIPDFSVVKDAWISLGYVDLPKGTHTDVYTVIKDKNAIALLECSPLSPKPMCRGSQVYNEDIILQLDFNLIDQEWYLSQGGYSELSNRIDSWVIN